MDRTTVAALIVAGGSVVVSALSEQSAIATLFYGCGLLIVVSVIAYPDVAEAAFRSSWDGFTHGGARPTPGSLIRVAAWLLLITVIVVHHYMAFTGAADALHR